MFNCWLFPPALCWVQSLKDIFWILNYIIRDPKGIVKFKFLMHYLPFNAQKWWLWIIDIFIALLCMCVLTCHFLSFYAIFALKFCPILTKDFHCLNSNNLRKRNLSNGRFSVTVSFQFGVTFIMFIDLFFNFLYRSYEGFSVIVYLLRQNFFPIYIYIDDVI